MQAQITVPPRTTQEWEALSSAIETAHPKLEAMPWSERRRHLDLGSALRDDWRHLAPEAMRRRWALQERLLDAEAAVREVVEDVAGDYTTALEGSFARDKSELAALRRRLEKVLATLTARLDEAEQQLRGVDA